VTYEPIAVLPYSLAWRKNGLPLDMQNIRIRATASGGLVIDAVEPSDAGRYEITAVVSNDFGCQCALFDVYVECKQPATTLYL
jgi:hypothetical protein